MQKFYLGLVLILSLLVLGNAFAQDAKSLAGKNYTIDGYIWEFKENGNVKVTGEITGEGGVVGKYELDGEDVIAKVGPYTIYGTFDGTDFAIVGMEQGEAEVAKTSTGVNYDEVRIKDFPIAMQAYTFREFSFMEALDKTHKLGVKYIQAYPGQKLSPDGTATFDVDLTENQIAEVKERLDELDITLTHFGVADIADEASGKKLFEFAKKMGIGTIVTEPPFHLLPMIDELAGKHQINVAIHNHPKPTRYWHPGITYYYIKDLSRRIGICADTGHWTRSGIIATEALQLFKGRIFDVHLKDLNEFGKGGAYDVPFGTGVTKIQNILAQLSLQNYSGTLTIEHEKAADALNPGPPILEGIKYIQKITYYAGYKEILANYNGWYTKHGWNHYGPGYFELDPETGVLTASGGMGLLWYSGKMYDNFVLDVDYRCHAPNTNSGIFIRVPEMVTSNDYIHKSFEIQIDDRETPSKHSTGAVYDAEPPKLVAGNQTGEWNHYRITFDGDLIKVELNGQLVNNWKAEPRGKINSFAKKGYIGLQNHDSEARVSFRNIYVKELKD